MDKSITIRVEEAWLAEIDEWRRRQKVPPTRSQLIRRAVERFVSEEVGK